MGSFFTDAPCLSLLPVYLRADVVMVGEPTILNRKSMIFILAAPEKKKEDSICFPVVTATGAICLFTSLLGYVGIMLNNRAVLTFYNLFLWVCFGLIAAIGYTAYRKNKWNIEVTTTNKKGSFDRCFKY